MLSSQAVQGIVSGMFEIPQQAHQSIKLFPSFREDRQINHIADRTEFRIVMAIEHPSVAAMFSCQFAGDDVPQGRDRAADALPEKIAIFEVGEASQCR
ncbi:hypothetical protein roselon_03524 [Roseibacterium elongatum DSM 19469]|uniref:Uncharacterized protein n=1 Tax=Roseicyclus elongatus DSM 19469 TaxID=1294273 RepID=W8RX38_9RHOB|nr:hypothetical protein roselon_03524 [Roseibacterium elongatum DSM 19469]